MQYTPIVQTSYFVLHNIHKFQRIYTQKILFLTHSGTAFILHTVRYRVSSTGTAFTLHTVRYRDDLPNNESRMRKMCLMRG